MIPTVSRRRAVQSPLQNGDSRFPCEQCGASLTFRPGATELQCGHCGHVQRISQRGGQEEALRELDYEMLVRGLLREGEFEDTKSIACPNCGAMTDFPDGMQAAKCPFCDTPVVTDTGSKRQVKPQGLIPFQLDEKSARDAMTKWLGSLWLAPNGLQEYARKGRALNGVYVPYWTYDSRTQTRYQGQRGDDYYETRTVIRDGKQQTERVRKTRWRSVSGHVARDFDDVLVLAETALPRSYTDALEPWDLRSLTPYQPQYLSGFNAEGYDIGPEQGFDLGKERMAAVIQQDIRRDIGGDHQRISSMDTNHRDVTTKHILLPVWVAAYKYNNKTFRFVVNGQTGKVKGERPWSAWKIFFLVLVIMIAVGLFIAVNEGRI